MDLQTLSTAMGNLSTADYERFVSPFNEALFAAECTTVNRVAMWCAQVGHESGGLRYMEEIADGSAYEGRLDLGGNTQPGDAAVQGPWTHPAHRQGKLPAVQRVGTQQGPRPDR